MTFLAPAALLGVLLLTVPVLAHLFKPRKMRQTPFSSLRWLKQTRQRLSRRIQWHQWLLFLARAGIIALLVLALARPLLGLGGERPTDRFVILDLGPSMAYQAEDAAVPLSRAHELASALVARTRPGDRTALLLAGARPRLLAPPAADAVAHLPALFAARTEASDARLSAALPVVRGLLQESAERDVELVFLTDQRPQAWRQSEVQTFLKDQPRPVRVRLFDVGVGAARNGWITDARLLGPEGGDRLLRVEASCTGEGQVRTVRLGGVAGLGEDAQTITLRPGQITRADFRIPAGVSLAGQVAELRLEPADALPGDDVYYANLGAGAALLVLLVEPEVPGPDGRAVGLYLRAGFEALGAASRHALKLLGRTSANVSAGDFSKADLVVFAGVPRLAADTRSALEARVRAGAGLVVFLGDGFEPAQGNATLHNPAQPSESLLPIPLQGEALTHGGETLVQVRWDHPLLAALNDPLLSDLGRSRFTRHAAFAAEPGKGSLVLARFGDGSPALIDHPVGAGRVLVVNTSASSAWTDLPRRKSYVPLLDQALGYLTAGGVRRRFTSGEPITLPLPEHQEGALVTVSGPGGVRLTPRLVPLRGQTLLHLDGVDTPGVYRVERGGTETLTFVVNAGRARSPLTVADAATLEGMWAPASVEILSADAAAEAIAAGSVSWPLWPLLVFLAGLLLAIETIYAAILCPRVNPAAVDSVVHGHGILRPLNEPGNGSVSAETPGRSVAPQTTEPRGPANGG